MRVVEVANSDGSGSSGIDSSSVMVEVTIVARVRRVLVHGVIDR